MGLEAVIAEIQEKGKTEAAAIITDAESKKLGTLNAAQQQVETIKNVAKDDIEKTVSHIITQEEAAGQLITKRQVLNAQKELMDEVYTQALVKITSMPESFHKDAISALLRRAKTEIPEGRVSCSDRDVNALKAVLKESEFSAYSFGSVNKIDGGIIVESTDGTLQVDYSYRTFLNQVWESGLKNASDILFT